MPQRIDGNILTCEEKSDNLVSYLDELHTKYAGNTRQQTNYMVIMDLLCRIESLEEKVDALESI